MGGAPWSKFSPPLLTQILGPWSRINPVLASTWKGPLCSSPPPPPLIPSLVGRISRGLCECHWALAHTGSPGPAELSPGSEQPQERGSWQWGWGSRPCQIPLLQPHSNGPAPHTMVIALRVIFLVPAWALPLSFQCSEQRLAGTGVSTAAPVEVFPSLHL